MAIFLLGMAAGIACHRIFIIQVVGKFSHTACDYCQFEIEKEKLFPRKKK